MATRKTDPAASVEISILELQEQTIKFFLLGNSPMIFNRLSEKAKRELLMPAPKKNQMERASSLKHEPLQEFRASAHKLKDDNAPTLLAMPAICFKGALRNAALDIPGAFKSSIGRLTRVTGVETIPGVPGSEYIPIYGIPKVVCSVVRMADKDRTPDVRTRAIVERWACELEVTFMRPQLRDQGIANLLGAAGVIIGVGDWRQEKGSGSYGLFKVVGNDEAEWKRIVATGGRAVQVAAMDDPEPYNEDTEELLAWYDVELRRRGIKAA